MTTFDVLDPQTRITGHYFLEASAGTGKTFAIENIVPRLLLECDPPISISQILVVTFTRAATRELKARIYQNLLKIKDALEQKVEGPAYLKNYTNLKRDWAKRRIEEALCFFETAQIFTLHSFCLTILQEFAFESKFLLSSKKEEECEQKEKLKEYIKDFLRRGVDPQVISPSQLRHVLQKSGRQIDSLCDILLSKLESKQSIQVYPTALERWKVWNEELEKLERISQKDLWSDFCLLSPRGAPARQLPAQEFFSWVEKGSCLFEEWDQFLRRGEFFLEDLSIRSSSKPKNGKTLLHPEVIGKIQETFTPLYKESLDYGSLILILARAAASYYEKGRREVSHFNPDDLVLELEYALLQDSEFCKKVRDRYQVVIIDEFQDTDPSQWKIFETLFFHTKEKLSAIYLVGDPKQSIYAFRRADVYLYLRAASLLGEKALAYLDTNYRSHPHLIDALNVFFSQRLPSCWMILPFLKKGLEVRPVKSKPLYDSALDEDEKKRLHFFIVEDGTKGGKKWPKEEVEESKLFPFIAQEILRLREKKCFCFQKMAVLVKDRFQANRLREALNIHRIPCFMQKSLDVSSSIAFQVMRDILLALAWPSHLSYLKRFLAGSLVGFCAEEIEGGFESPLLQRAKQYLMDAEIVFRKKGVGVFFQNLLQSSFDKEASKIGKQLLAQEDPSLYFELRQLVQILLEHCQEGLYDPIACLDFLEKLRELPSGSDLLKQPSEEEEDQVQVMTIHKSKGLEFDIVFALGVVSRHTQEDEWVFIRKEEGSEMASSSQSKEWDSLYKEEMDAEKLRQLYVALTRAKERMYIPVVISKGESLLKKGSAAPIELLFGAIDLQEYSLEKAYENIQCLSLEKIKEYLEDLEKTSYISYEIIDDAIRVVSSMESSPLNDLVCPPTIPVKGFDSYLLSFSSLVEEKEESEKIYLDSPLEGDLPLGAETGTVIHSILEAVCKADLQKKDPSFIRLLVSKFCKGSCLEGLENLVFEKIEKVRTLPLSFLPGIVTLSDISPKEMRVEMEFLYPHQSSYLKGFIDLIFRYEGKYYILDWKTNYLGPCEEDYSLEKIEACMRQNDYYLQASIYAEALKKYLALFHKESFEDLFGGAVYFFIRHAKPYFFRPKIGNIL